MAEWDSAYLTSLPDSAFACVDDSGRHYPHHDKSGALDLPHLRNALSRIGDKSNTQCGADHLRAHAKAADIGQSSLPADYESRSFVAYELREAQAEAMPTIVGHAARFGQLSEDLGGFREKISHEAFRRTLREGDCRALWDHDSRLLLGRASNGTLKLREDQQGLMCEISPPDTSYARDLAALIRRGDLNGMSFGFRVIRDDWGMEGTQTVRTLKDVDLLDVSAVTYPAYPHTDVAMRSLREFTGRAAVQGDRGAEASAAARAGAQARIIERRRRLVGQRSI